MDRRYLGSSSSNNNNNNNDNNNNDKNNNRNSYIRNNDDDAGFNRKMPPFEEWPIGNAEDDWACLMDLDLNLNDNNNNNNNNNVRTESNLTNSTIDTIDHYHIDKRPSFGGSSAATSSFHGSYASTSIHSSCAFDSDSSVTSYTYETEDSSFRSYYSDQRYPHHHQYQHHQHQHQHQHQYHPYRHHHHQPLLDVDDIADPTISAESLSSILLNHSLMSDGEDDIDGEEYLDDDDEDDDDDGDDDDDDDQQEKQKEQQQRQQRQQQQQQDQKKPPAFYAPMLRRTGLLDRGLLDRKPAAVLSVPSRNSSTTTAATAITAASSASRVASTATKPPLAATTSSTSTSSIKPSKKTRKRRTKKEPKIFKKIFVEKRDNDVLMGRGGASNHHPGNQLYRAEIVRLQPYYKTLPRHEKTQLSRSVVQWVQEEQKGRFLMRDDKRSKWYLACEKHARQKASQALREDHSPEAKALKREKKRKDPNNNED